MRYLIILGVLVGCGPNFKCINNHLYEVRGDYLMPVWVRAHGNNYEHHESCLNAKALKHEGE